MNNSLHIFIPIFLVLFLQSCKTTAKVDSTSDQILLIEDEVFLEYLLRQKIDANSDKLIQKSEALQLKKISLYKSKVKNLSFLSAFKELESFYLHDCYSIGSLDFVDLPKLKTIDIKNSSLSQMQLQDLPSLSVMDIRRTELEQVIIKKLDRLNKVRINNNSLKSIVLKDLPYLWELDVSGNSLRKLDLRKCKNLREVKAGSNRISFLKLKRNNIISRLSLGYNELSKLKTNRLANVYDLSVSGNALKSLDLSPLTRLTNFYCRDTNLIKELDFSFNSEIRWVMVDDMGLKRIVFGENSSIYFLDVKGNDLEVIDLNNAIGLKHLSIDSNRSLVEIGVVNCNSLEHISMSSCISLRLIKCSANNRDVILNWMTDEQKEKIKLDVY